MEKMPILWVFEGDVFVVQKGLFAIKNVENSFFTIYFTIYDMGIHGVTSGYRGLQGVTRGDRGFTKGLRWVPKDYRNFFLSRTFPDIFSWSILHKNQT